MYFSRNQTRIIGVEGKQHTDHLNIAIDATWKIFTILVQNLKRRD